MEDCRWEDAIDIDDSDLLNPIIPSNNPINYNPTPFCPLSHSFPSLKPCSQSQSQSQFQNPNPRTRIDSSPPKRPAARPPIPGPAGAVQVAMHRRSSAAAMSPIFSSQGQQVDRRSILEEDEEEEDEDFKLNPWLCADEFLGQDVYSRWPIDSIKDRSRDGSADRIPQVVGVVKSCVPNGLGDLFITLKDPTGLIGASIHRNVLMENNLGGDLSVGCVLILKQVAVFCPSHSACYLNVTTNNMLKLISKDCGSPDKQMMPSSEARYGAFGKRMEARQGPAGKLTSLKQREESIALNEVRREINNGRILDCRKTGLAENLPYNFTSRDSNVAIKSDLGTNISTNIAAKLNRVIATTNMVGNPCPKTNSASNMVGKADPSVNTAGTVASKADLRTISTTDAPVNMDTESDIRAKKPTKMIPSVSVAQWTDEQLLELFADYQDDVELVHHSI